MLSRSFNILWILVSLEGIACKCQGETTESPMRLRRHRFETRGTSRHSYVIVVNHSTLNICSRSRFYLFNHAQIGDVVKVTKMNINGQWEGEIDGKIGLFPFTHVEFIDSDNPDDEEG